MSLENGDRERTRNEIIEDTTRLKEWLYMQPHLPHNIEENTLRCFVCGTKSLEIAKQKLDTYFTLRGNMRQLFSFENRNARDPKFQENKAILNYYLPEATPEGYRVLMISAGEDMEKFDCNHEYTKTSMMLDLAMSMWPDMKGIIIIYDFYNLAPFLPKVNIATSAKLATWFQKSVPMRLKKLVFINSNSAISYVMNSIIKPFLSAKIQERTVTTTEGGDYLKEFIPEELIPKEYGGKGPSSRELNDQWQIILEERADWFKETSALMSDEKKRLPDKENTYGLQGTFRSLAFD